MVSFAMLTILQVVPILRAGLVLVEQVATVLPATQTYHLGDTTDRPMLINLAEVIRLRAAEIFFFENVSSRDLCRLEIFVFENVSSGG